MAMAPQHNKAGEQVAAESNSSTAESAILVTWATPTDPDNPLQWQARRKWTNVTLISAQGLFTPLAATLPTVAAPAIAADFHVTSPIVPLLTIALFVLGLGLGPLYLAPLSEAYGRRAVYVGGFSAFACLNVGCALAPNMAALVTLRLLAGMAGSAGPSLGGASIGDMFVRAERGRAQALYSLGPLCGPVLGGVLGGFILDGTGSWRWLMWFIVIAPVAAILASVLFLRETYAPVLLRCRAARLQRVHREKRYRTDYDDVHIRRAIFLSATRPLRMLFTSPICASMAVYVGVVYGILYINLISLSLLFSPTPRFGLYTYGWTHGTTGLSFLSVGVGLVFGTMFCTRFGNKVYQFRRKIRTTEEGAEPSASGRNGNANAESAAATMQPENRLYLLQFAMLLIPAGLIVYAWSAGRTHWIVPLIGSAVFAVGMQISYVARQAYMVDIFGRFAASALATSTILRSVIGCVFTLVGFEIYKDLGYAWGTMLLAFLCLAMAPLPAILIVLGPRLRKQEFLF